MIRWGEYKMALKEENYPMTYDEFEKRITELALEEYSGKDPNLFMDFIEDLKSQEEIKALYKDTCYRHDTYGDAFTDENLKSQPVRLLYMVYDE